MRNPFLGAPVQQRVPVRSTTIVNRAARTLAAPQPNIYEATASSHSLQLNSPGGINYPAAGQSVTLLTYPVPSGQTLVITSAALANIGAAIVDYQEILAWHLLRNGAGVKGFENLLAQLGTLQQPQPVNLIFNEGEILQATVSLLAGQVIPAGNVPAARLLGFVKLAVPMPNLLPRG